MSEDYFDGFVNCIQCSESHSIVTMHTIDNTFVCNKCFKKMQSVFDQNFKIAEFKPKMQELYIKEMKKLAKLNIPSATATN